MSITVTIAREGVRAGLSKAAAGSIVRRVLRAEKVRSATISVAFVSNRAIAALNRRHLGHSGPTDVIAFPLRAVGEAAVAGGDIYIAPEVARVNARRFRTRIREELARLLVHGTLHVLGYDHPEGAGRELSGMWRRQEQLLANLAAGARRP